MSTLTFIDQNAVENAIKSVRDDQNETQWAIFGYDKNNSGSNCIVVEGTGSGDLSEFTASLKDDHISYGILRVIDYIDNHPTVKFVGIQWVGPSVKYIQKAKSSTHKGAVNTFIGSCHINLAVESKDELSTDEVMGRVQDASGSGNRTLEVTQKRETPVARTQPTPINFNAPTSTPASAAKPKPATPTPAPARVKSVPSTTTTTTTSSSSPARKNDGVQVPEDRSPIDAVRSDAPRDADWVLYSYEGNANKIRYVAHGAGTVENLKAHLTTDNIYYGLIRVTDIIDGHTTTKFVYLIFIGENVRIMRKALVATHKGAVTAFIGQHHVDLTATDPSEFSEDSIMEVVRNASGSASHVMDEVTSSAGRLQLH